MEKKKDPKILERLQSGNVHVVTETIAELGRNNETGYLEDIFALYYPDQSPEIKKRIAGLIKNNKSTGITPQVMKLLKGTQDIHDLNILIAACWQSAMDFSPYVPDFIDFVLKGNYETILETFSVIENSVSRIDPDVADNQTARLKEHMAIVDKDKRNLLLEIIKILALERR